MSFFPASDNLTIGGRLYTVGVPGANKTLITVSGALIGTISNLTPRLPNATSGYTPSGGNGFYITSVDVLLGTGGGIEFGYADNDCGFNSNTAPTNPVFWKSGTSSQSLINYIGGTTTLIQHPVNNFKVLNTKFIFVKTSGGPDLGFIQINGYEAV